MKQEYDFSMLKVEAKKTEKVVSYLEMKGSWYADSSSPCVCFSTSRTRHYMQEERREESNEPNGLLMMQELGLILCPALVQILNCNMESL